MGLKVNITREFDLALEPIYRVAIVHACDMYGVGPSEDRFIAGVEMPVENNPPDNAARLIQEWARGHGWRVTTELLLRTIARANARVVMQ